MKIAIWIIAALCLGLWSLLAWAIAAVLGLDPNWVNDLKPLVQQVPYADVLEQWIPGWQPMLLATLDLTRTLLGWAGGAGVVVVWVLWAVGAGLLLLLAVVLHVVVALVQRSARSATAPATAAAN